MLYRTHVNINWGGQGLRKRAKHKVHFDVLPRVQPRLAEGKACDGFEKGSLVDLKLRVSE